MNNNRQTVLHFSDVSAGPARAYDEELAMSTAKRETLAVLLSGGRAIGATMTDAFGGEVVLVGRWDEDANPRTFHQIGSARVTRDRNAIRAIMPHLPRGVEPRLDLVDPDLVFDVRRHTMGE